MNRADVTSVAMTDEEFLLIRDLIFEYSGIMLPDNVKFLVERRLRPRLDAFGSQSFREYYRAVKYGRDKTHELDEIVELITTNETYFFREQHQLQAFTREIVPALLARREGGDLVRIWSAGCSSGEEAYTIAMLLDELNLPKTMSFEIFGSDISRKVLRLARAGVYRDASFRDTPSHYIDRYFDRDGREYILRDSIRSRVTFGHLNLMDDAALALVANVDVIFCRNVMIYFAKSSRTKLLNSFFKKMRAGGYLLLGHSESLVNASTNFEIVALKNDIVYRKPISAGPSRGTP